MNGLAKSSGATLTDGWLSRREKKKQTGDKRAKKEREHEWKVKRGSDERGKKHKRKMKGLCMQYFLRLSEVNISCNFFFAAVWLSDSEW